MSEVAGASGANCFGQLLMSTQGGRGTLLGGIPGVPRGAVVIVGAGVLGTNATGAFLGIGAQVTVLDEDIEKLERIDQRFASRVTTLLATRHNLERSSCFADVLVGAIQEPGRRAEKIITRDMVREMRPGSVILDFSINDGGCVETSRPTTLRDPAYTVDGVLHFCVPNLPAAVSRTTSYGLTNAVLPYLKKLGRQGMIGMIKNDPDFAHGVQMYQGNLVHPEVAAALGRQVSFRLCDGEEQNMSWESQYRSKVKDASSALGRYTVRQSDLCWRRGGSPKVLINGLTECAPELRDVEITHILTFAEAPYADAKYADSFRVNALFIGNNVRKAVGEGRADFTPIFLSEIPDLFRNGSLPLDAALISLGPPDEHGFCSFGVEVGTTKPAAEEAKIVIAEINHQMPRTHGDSFIHISRLRVSLK